MEKRLALRYKHSTESGYLATNKNLEALPSFRKEDIHLTFIDVDNQLKHLAENDNISKVRRFITIQEIRNRLFELCNLCIHGMDIHAFASHEPGDKTPLNSECV
jgi:hypothetical protein